MAILILAQKFQSTVIPQISIEREQYYLDLCIGEYNILTIAGSIKGFKFSAEARLRMSGRRHTEESKAIMRQAKLGKNHPMFGKTVPLQIKKKLSIANGTAIKVTDLESNLEETCFSIRKAAVLLCVDHSTLSKRIKASNCFILNGRYKVEKV